MHERTCACTEIRNALKCSPVYLMIHLRIPTVWFLTRSRLATIIVILGEGDANFYSDTWCAEKTICFNFAQCHFNVILEKPY